MSGKVIQSNAFEIRKGLEEVESNFRNLAKKFEEGATVMKSYGAKTNVNFFNELASVVEGHGENQIKQITKLVQTAQEAAMDAHKRMQNVASSLDI